MTVGLNHFLFIGAGDSPCRQSRCERRLRERPESIQEAAGGRPFQGRSVVTDFGVTDEMQALDRAGAGNVEKPASLELVTLPGNLCDISMNRVLVRDSARSDRAENLAVTPVIGR